MASARITCPDCQSVLRPAKPVPDGKKVKCPKCGNTFTTPGLVEVVEVVEEVEEVEELPRKKASAKKAPEKKKKVAVKKADSPKPPAKKTGIDDDDEGGGGIYSFVGVSEEQKQREEENRPQIVYAPDMSIKDLRGPAQEAVVKPSNLMMLIGGLSALSNIFLICWSFWPMVFSDSVVDYYKVLGDYYKKSEDKAALQRVDSYKEFKDIKNEKELAIVQEANEEAAKWRYFNMGGFILALIYNAIAVTGAVKMQNLESRRWGIASSIMMLLPIGCSGLSGVLFVGFEFFEQMTGILGDLSLYYAIGVSTLPYLASLYVAVMSLRILLSQEVIDGFEYIAE